MRSSLFFLMFNGSFDRPSGGLLYQINLANLLISPVLPLTSHRTHRRSNIRYFNQRRSHMGPARVRLLSDPAFLFTMFVLLRQEKGGVSLGRGGGGTFVERETTRFIINKRLLRGKEKAEREHVSLTVPWSVQGEDTLIRSKILGLFRTFMANFTDTTSK